MQASFRGQVIAASERTITHGGYVYFPRETVRMELLHAAVKTDSDRACPHGVQFYDIAMGDTAGPRLAWSYEAPREALQPIDHWVGFWGEVEVA